MNYAVRVIDDKLGGTTKAATLLGERKSTVSGWKKRGIPHDKQRKIVRLAHLHGLDVGPADFFDDLDRQAS